MLTKKFLSKIDQKETDNEKEEEEEKNVKFIFSDFQLEEATNVIKDLIVLEKT